MELAPALLPGNEADAVALLRRYYEDTSPGFTGRWFDTWNPDGARSENADRFTSDDLVALSFLSISVPPQAAHRLLVDQRDDLSALLRQIPNSDLVEIEPDEINDQWAAWRLWDLLQAGRDGVGWVTAGKLLAYKRPRLIPVYDEVVSTVVGKPDSFWQSLNALLRDGDRRFHRHLLGLRDAAGLPEAVGALRVLDVVTWMTGKGYTPA